eukprot:evm.model.scf_789.3 EVM.evm.TU.scf_789.3   scf_789:18735-24399(+)
MGAAGWAFDFENDAGWRRHLARQRPASKGEVERLKGEWYKAEIDGDFDPGLAVRTGEDGGGRGASSVHRRTESEWLKVRCGGCPKVLRCPLTAKGVKCPSCQHVTRIALAASDGPAETPPETSGTSSGYISRASSVPTVRPSPRTNGINPGQVSRLDCGCGKSLAFRPGAKGVKCPGCREVTLVGPTRATLPPAEGQHPASPGGRLACSACGKRLKYLEGAAKLMCPGCRTINDVHSQPGAPAKHIPAPLGLGRSGSMPQPSAVSDGVSPRPQLSGTDPHVPDFQSGCIRSHAVEARSSLPDSPSSGTVPYGSAVQAVGTQSHASGGVSASLGSFQSEAAPNSPAAQSVSAQGRTSNGAVAPPGYPLSEATPNSPASQGTSARSHANGEFTPPDKPLSATLPSSPAAQVASPQSRTAAVPNVVGLDREVLGTQGRAVEVPSPLGVPSVDAGSPRVGSTPSTACRKCRTPIWFPAGMTEVQCIGCGESNTACQGPPVQSQDSSQASYVTQCGRCQGELRAGHGTKSATCGTCGMINKLDGSSEGGQAMEAPPQVEPAAYQAAQLHLRSRMAQCQNSQCRAPLHFPPGVESVQCIQCGEVTMKGALGPLPTPSPGANSGATPLSDNEWGTESANDPGQRLGYSNPAQPSPRPSPRPSPTATKTTVVVCKNKKCNVDLRCPEGASGVRCPQCGKVTMKRRLMQRIHVNVADGVVIPKEQEKAASTRGTPQPAAAPPPYGSMDCESCGTRLYYPVGALGVQCERCKHICYDLPDAKAAQVTPRGTSSGANGAAPNSGSSSARGTSPRAVPLGPDSRMPRPKADPLWGPPWQANAPAENGVPHPAPGTVHGTGPSLPAFAQGLQTDQCQNCSSWLSFPRGAQGVKCKSCGLERTLSEDGTGSPPQQSGQMPAGIGQGHFQSSNPHNPQVGAMECGKCGSMMRCSPGEGEAGCPVCGHVNVCNSKEGAFGKTPLAENVPTSGDAQPQASPPPAKDHGLAAIECERCHSGLSCPHGAENVQCTVCGQVNHPNWQPEVSPLANPAGTTPSPPAVAQAPDVHHDSIPCERCSAHVTFRLGMTEVQCPACNAVNALDTSQGSALVEAVTRDAQRVHDAERVSTPGSLPHQGSGMTIVECEKCQSHMTCMSGVLGVQCPSCEHINMLRGREERPAAAHQPANGVSSSDAQTPPTARMGSEGGGGNGETVPAAKQRVSKTWLSMKRK